MTLDDYAGDREKVVAFFTSLKYTTGHTVPIGSRENAYALSRGLLDLEGKIDGDGDWVWNGIGSPTDDRGNTIRSIRASVDPKTFDLLTMDPDEAEAAEASRRALNGALHRHGEILRKLKRLTGRCNCNSHSTWNHTLAGMCGMQPALWGTCPYHKGQACTQPVVGVIDTQKVRVAFVSARRLGLTPDEFIAMAPDGD